MSTSPPSLALQHLYMIRAQVDLAVAALEGEQIPVATGCLHPEDKRMDASVMDGTGPRWKCLLCDAEFEGAA
jgi:hypothetical protein